MPDQLRVESNERLDIQDFQFLVNDHLDEMQRFLVNNLFLPPSLSEKLWIIAGFTQSNPAGAQVQVTRGAAILARRVGGEVLYGALALEGQVQQIVDMASYGDGTYEVYIRFKYIPSSSQSRTFWNPAGEGSEYSQTIFTRLAADWEIRIESGTPGTEWLKIAQVVKSGGAVTITDERELYFEGRAATTPPAAKYRSDWGGGTDRDADRSTYGIQDWRTFASAIRKRFEEMNGDLPSGDPGRWWEENIDQQGIPQKIGMEDLLEDDIWVSGATYALVSGLEASYTEAVVYLGGRRMVVPAKTSLILPDNQSGYIEILEAGDVNAWIANTGAKQGIRLWAFTTSGGAITVMTDIRSSDANQLELKKRFYNPTDHGLEAKTGVKNGSTAGLKGVGPGTTTSGDHSIGVIGDGGASSSGRNATGVYGEATGFGSRGVQGISAKGVGLYGEDTDAVNPGYGVYGKATGAGTGVQGWVNGTGSTGVSGYGGGNGWGVVADSGPSPVKGALRIIPRGTPLPTNPSAGDFYFLTTTNKPYFYDGSNWYRIDGTVV